ncbi:MAG: hypothetical protein B1H03_03055 [Planctomycetales bacterium 4484_113]|nr:MAG: hypothetical protein B1H03_03055 [Planctomycetales bacterium 4484_113]
MGLDGFPSDQLANHLQKERGDFTAADLRRYVLDHDIHMMNFRYVGGNGRLKTLSFALRDEQHIDELLHDGERVDGSSLFSCIEPAASDLYVVPRYATAFEDPFSEEPTLSVLCSYFDRKGEPLDMAPENLPLRAEAALSDRLGLQMHALGEIEYYVVYHAESELYPGVPQHNYHESQPFVKWAAMREGAIRELARLGAQVKYAHAEVGDVVTEGDLRMEQHEIEFLPEPLAVAADHVVLAKWLLRNLSSRAGVAVTFAPKLVTGHAGNGMHFHLGLSRDGQNALSNKDDKLTDSALKAIGGLLTLAPALTAFGNKNPASYLRLVPRQEAPTYICWGETNRSALVRIPLSWFGVSGMVARANPRDPDARKWESVSMQTLEWRASDGSADVHQLVAGLASAILHGHSDAAAVARAKNLHIEGNLFDDDAQVDRLDRMPGSCAESAEALLAHRNAFERDGVFPPALIDGIARELAAFDDRELLAKARGDAELSAKLAEEYFHCG